MKTRLEVLALCKQSNLSCRDAEKSFMIIFPVLSSDGSCRTSDPVEIKHDICGVTDKMSSSYGNVNSARSRKHFILELEEERDFCRHFMSHKMFYSILSARSK
jgi:hypothetical protein